MNMDSAAVFLAGTILYAFGGIIILIGVIIANNLIHKFWKSFGWTFFPGFLGDSHNSRFMTQEEVNEYIQNEGRGPSVDPKNNGSSKKAT